MNNTFWFNFNWYFEPGTVYMVLTRIPCGFR